MAVEWAPILSPMQSKVSCRKSSRHCHRHCRLTESRKQTLGGKTYNTWLEHAVQCAQVNGGININVYNGIILSEPKFPRALSANKRTLVTIWDEFEDHGIAYLTSKTIEHHPSSIRQHQQVTMRITDLSDTHSSSNIPCNSFIQDTRTLMALKRRFGTSKLRK